MRPTQEIDDPKWDDIRDRDALIRKLCHVVRGQLERCEADNTICDSSMLLIENACEAALLEIGDETSVINRGQ